jgi:hypothetical protein
MNEQPDNSPRQAGHEPLGIRVPILLMGIAGLVATIILSFGVTWWLRSSLSAGRPAQSTQLESMNTNNIKAPLEPDQRAHRIRGEKQQQALLKQYEWLDSKHEFARIPIERAMELTVNRYQSSAKEKQP